MTIFFFIIKKIFIKSVCVNNDDFVIKNGKYQVKPLAIKFYFSKYFSNKKKIIDEFVCIFLLISMSPI